MTAKFPTVATLVGLVVLAIGLLAGPAWAQYPPGGGGGVVTPSPAPSPVPSEGDPTFVVGTPGATITVTGTNWGEARVTVVRRNGSTSTSSTSSASSDRVAFSTTSSADSSGRLAPVELPADLEPGEYDLVIEGTDASGEERTETQRLAVQDARALAQTEEQGGASNLPLILGIAAVGLAGGAFALRRRQTA